MRRACGDHLFLDALVLMKAEEYSETQNIGTLG